MIDLSTCPLLTTADLKELVRQPTIVDKAIKAGWIKPIRPDAGKSLFTRASADKLVARISAGDMP